VFFPCSLASWNVLLGLLQQPLDTLRIYAVGDINLGGQIASRRLMAGDTLYSFRALLDTLQAAHITFGNLESPIAADSPGTDSTGMVFTAPGLAAEALRRAGFDIVSTANNHIWDGGQRGVIETMRRLSEVGVLFVGSGIGRDMAQQPVIVRRDGWRVAFFAVTRAWNPAPNDFHRHEGARYVAWGDPAWIYPAIERLKAERRADLIVVSVHAGPEYADTPPTAYREFLEGLVDAGADLVLAHHPHVLQPVVRHRGKPIAQSLGNFIFYQLRPWADLSAVLRVVVTPDKRLRVSAVPVRAGPQAELLEGAAADSVRRRLKVPLAGSRTGR
jgi:poly-gamma-glutamate capsule biosynthesis protein CapA/YwtB (metallophosphatase superfamily)